MPRNKKGMALWVGPKKSPKAEHSPYVTKIVNPMIDNPTTVNKA